MLKFVWCLPNWGTHTQHLRNMAWMHCVDHRVQTWLLYTECTYSDAESAIHKSSISSLYWAVKELKQNKQTKSTAGPMAMKSFPNYTHTQAFCLFCFLHLLKTTMERQLSSEGACCTRVPGSQSLIPGTHKLTSDLHICCVWASCGSQLSFHFVGLRDPI